MLEPSSQHVGIRVRKRAILRAMKLFFAFVLVSMPLLLLFGNEKLLLGIETQLETLVIARGENGTNMTTTEIPIEAAGVFPRTRISPVCRPRFGTTGRTIKRIYFVHMRKAGGTSLKTYLRWISQAYNLTFEHAEGTSIEYPGSRNDTLYVTHLRDPVQRTISHFKYEGRWPCLELLTNKSFVPTLENAANLQEWIDHNVCKQTFLMNLSGLSLWLCSSNCYIQWLNYKSREGCNSEDHIVDSPRYQEAAEKAYQFHVVVDVQRLFNSEQYGRSLERFFGKRGLVGRNSRMWCGLESAEANAQVPLRMTTNSTLEDLYRRNHADYSLFNELMDCPADFEFPEGSLSEFVAI